jgi:hypothetical protein
MHDDITGDPAFGNHPQSFHQGRLLFILTDIFTDALPSWLVS